jgi:hypothetical protein
MQKEMRYFAMRLSFRFKIVVLLTLGAVCALSLMYIVAARAAGPATLNAGQSKQWHIVSLPNGGKSMTFTSISAVSATDIWAVGTKGKNSAHALIAHWNGSKWSLVPFPVPQGSFSEGFSGVVALASNNVWAVGQSSTHTLIEHWNGSKWSIVPSPNPSGTNNRFLASVSAHTANDIWAAGGYEGPNSFDLTLVEHWNGSKWSIVPSPSPDASLTGDDLAAVQALSANNVWASGFADAGGSDQGITPTLIEHWNGSSWSVVSSPAVKNAANYLTGMAAIATNNIWAVGSSMTNTTNQSATLIEHWNGSKWSITPSSTPANSSSSLNAVATHTGSDIWAVGNSLSNSSNVQKPLTEHFDGSKWNVVSAPTISGQIACNFSGVAMVGSNAWAVGGCIDNFTNQNATALIEFYG